MCNSFCHKFCHITPLLETLYWLPYSGTKIAFKILLIVYKAMNGQAQTYISELILRSNSNAHSHNLHSSNDMYISLKCQKSKTKVTLGDYGFSCAAPKIGITFLFQSGNPNQLFHLRLNWKPTCVCKLFLIIHVLKCKLFHCTLLGKIISQCLSMELFSRSAIEYMCIHSYCTI